MEYSFGHPSLHGEDALHKRVAKKHRHVEDAAQLIPDVGG